jgi:two-component system OmpR family sensor kinase
VTLRARLTLWYTAVLAAVLILFGTIVFISLTYSLTAQVEDNLNRTANDILRDIQRARSMPDSLAITLRALEFTTNVFVQLWEGNENLIWQSSNIPPMNEAFDPDTLQVTENTFTSKTIQSLHLRVLTVPLVSVRDESVVGYLQIAGSLETIDLAREMLLAVLVGGGLLAIVVSGVVGYMTARAALRPLDQVTDTALQITRADDLSRRIPLSGPPTGEDGRLILAFNETLERLESLFETQRRFLADVSHELRTPLTAIRGNVDLIKHMGTADHDALDAITGEVDRMTRLVSDLLLLARAESGKLPLAQEVVELDTLMLEVFKQTKLLANDKVEIRIGQEDQARVLGDVDRLKQVFLNLVANALDYTPQGGSVTMSLRCEGEWACLSVQDTGPGIPEEEIPHIFERFYRVERSRKRKASGGIGLGLSIAHWITLSHGGRIEVTSEVDKGSTFGVWLPRIADGCEEIEGG